MQLTKEESIKKLTDLANTIAELTRELAGLSTGEQVGAAVALSDKFKKEMQSEKFNISQACITSNVLCHGLIAQLIEAQKKELIQ